MSQGREVGVRGKASVSEGTSETEASASAASKTTFTNKGPLPPVSTRKASSHKATASELAFGAHEFVESDDVSQSVLQIAADVVQNETSRMIGEAPVQYQAALWCLLSAATGHSNGKPLSGKDRLSMLDVAMDGLRPVIDDYRSDSQGAEWLETNLLSYTKDLHDQARFVEARDRVDNSVRVGKGEVVELPDADHPRERGAVLHEEIPKLVETMGLVNEQVIRLAHDGIHHQAEALMEEKPGAKAFGAGSLVELQNALTLASGLLTLNDSELQERLGSLQGTGFFHHVANYSELVGAIVGVTSGAIGVTASYSAIIAKMAGDQMLVQSATGLARATGLAFGNVISGIEIVHGIAVLLDPHASSEEKVEGAVGASSGAAWVVGSRAGGAAVGFAASLAVLAGYEELKLAANMYWDADLGITSGFMRLAFETIQTDGADIASMADKLAKAGILRASEQDPEKAAALTRVEAVLAQQLGELVDSFIDDCQPRGFEAGVAAYPGEYTILREAFAPVAKYKGARTPEMATEAANVALDRIRWSLTHAGDLIVASAKEQHLSDLQEEESGKQGNEKE